MNCPNEAVYDLSVLPVAFARRSSLRIRLRSCIALLVVAAVVVASGSAQTANRISAKIDSAQVRALANHHPLWAVTANDLGAVPAGQAFEDLTIVLARSPEQEQAFEQFLAAQQDPSSPDYHHWLTSAEVGDRFGLSAEDVATVSGWVESQGLHVKWVSPSRMFIEFGGAAGDIGRAFGTELHRYKVEGRERVSVAVDPVIPAALAQAVKSIRGLYTIDEQPTDIAIAMQSDSPEVTTCNGAHFIGPGDFQAIYDLPDLLYGKGQTIGIVGRSRTNQADFDNFKNLVGGNFTDPTEIVPTAFGGVDPGPALTSPPTGTVSTGDQSEATLDVLRAGSTAFDARLLLVVATSASGGIGTDAQYLVQTTPLPAQVMTISFGACESAAGPAGVTYWDTLFQQAAAEGISTFVSSGDSGAAGCDAAFSAPPATPKANSPNYICSSSYATCVGGTEFNDTANPGMYWSIADIGQTAHGYIPEGGWNESWDGTHSVVVASGGGASTVIATPSWQTGTGVPAARTGRYTPDISFSSSLHDRYFGCFAAGGGSCVVSNGSFTFEYFGGTSAAAPSMAGIAAMLNENLGSAQGNLNPGLYQMAVSTPIVFHDVTLATSGVTICDLNTPSMCNNSIGGPSGLSGGQPGFAVGAGYDEVTGLGSLDAATFVDAYATASKLYKPTLTWNSGVWPVNQDIPINPWVSAGPYSPNPTGSIVVTVGSFTSAAIPLANGMVSIKIPAHTLAMGSYTLTAMYTPDAASAQIYLPSTGTGTLTVGQPYYISPVIVILPQSWWITSTETVPVTVSVRGGSGNPVPTGSVTATSGSYSSGPLVITPGTGSFVDGEASFTIPAGALPVGQDPMTVTYTPDKAGADLYNVTSVSDAFENEGATILPHVTLDPGYWSLTTADTISIKVTLDGELGNPAPTGSVVLTSGSYRSSTSALSGGVAMLSIPATSLPVGSSTLTATYTPDTSGAQMYSSATGTGSVQISLAQKLIPAVTLTQVTTNPVSTQPLTISATVTGVTGYPAPTGDVVFWDNNGFSIKASLVGGTATATAAPGSFYSGSNPIQATYNPDSPASYYYSTTMTTITVTVAKATPTVTVTPSLSSLLTTDALNVTVVVNGGTGAPTSGGTVTLTTSNFNSGAVHLSGGSANISIPALNMLPGATQLSTTYSGDSNYNTATGSATVQVALPAGAGFTLSEPNLTLTRGASSGNTDNVTIAPSNGFTGSVNLTATITGSPAGAQYPPTLGFGSTTTVVVAGGIARTALLTVLTTAGTSGTLASPPRPGARWYSAGGAALACVLIFWIPVRRRAWRMTICSVLMLIALVCGPAACGGGGGSSSGGGGGGGTPGTSTGVYTITITGTAGSLTTSNTMTLTVQ